MNNKDGKFTLYPKEEPIQFDEKYFFPIDNSYPNLNEFYFYFTLFVVDDEEKCSGIRDFFKENNIIENITCSNNEKSANNMTANIIKIKMEKDKYRIYLTSKRNDLFQDFTFFDKEDLDQDQIIDPFYVKMPTTPDKKSNFEMFWELQSLLSKLLIKLNGKEIGPNFKMKFGYNSYPEHYSFTENYSYTTYSILSLLITLQFSLLAYSFNIRIIDEKENKLNILLERQGITKFQYNISWLITFYALSLISIISVLILIFSYIKYHYLGLIISMILFTFNIYCVCIFFATCIKTTKTGTTAIKFYNFGSILLGFVIVLPKTSRVAKVIFCFIPQINFYLNLCSIFCLNNFKDITWMRLWLKAANMSFFETIIMFIVEIIFYLGLTFIIQSFKDSGLDFISYVKSFFTKVSRKKNDSPNLNIENEKIKVINFEIHHQELSQINKQKKEQNQCLKLENVLKRFGDLKAVDNFNAEFFPNEIFCLLGHNGAGKTTTINMISGIIDPDKGDILLNGKSLVTNKDYLYKNIGLCQQEDIFFDYLTVQEHLEYMCRIKGSKINNTEINELIAKIDLAPKKDALCSTLSGGQKRKLCIALALIGGSKIVLLDEPTSGMDVMARRALWEFLKNYKQDKIMLLTTHFLDEAEYLGDRIGIMSDGLFLCSGTSSFLKSKYPCGFNINLLINSSIFNEEYKQEFYDEIKKYEPNAEIKVASKGIFSINIQSNNQKIPDIFNYIEENKSKYGIEDYTVSSTTLEDVFLKINNKAVLNDLKYLNKNENKNEQFNNEIPSPAGFCEQLRAQIVRGLYPLCRNKILFFFELLSGLGFVYIFIIFFSNFIINSNKTKLDFISVLKTNNIYIYEKNTKENFLKNSDTYNNLGKSISFTNIKEDSNSIEDFMNLVYNKAFANIAKGALYIDGSNENLYEVYNTEVDNSLNGYIYANIILFVSAFLKNHYDIDATIFKTIEFSSLVDNGMESLSETLSDSIVLIIVCLISLFGYVIFLGGLMFEKIKEKRTNIKHLLYLSGNNIWSYWIGFYIVDYLKILFFNIFLIIPIFFVSGAATYFGLDMLLISLSSLSFIYFISFFCSKDDEGAKILFLVVFGFLIIVALIGLVLGDKINEYINSFEKVYVPNIFDLTPVTSMGLSFIRIIISYTLFSAIDQIKNTLGFEIQLDNYVGFSRPQYYLYTSYIAQCLNFALYTLLLMFVETGALGKVVHWIELKFFGQKNNYIFGKQEGSENNINYNNYINYQNNNINDISQKEFKGKSKDGGNSVSIPLNNRNNNIISSCQFSADPLLNSYVQKEIEKINSGKELTTKITGLIKTFYGCCGCKNVRAINNLYLGLEPNEKFGLLGFNGSGKTTTFRAITNEILTDSGSITLFGYNTKTQFEHIRTIIGYCPQINPLFDFMKVKEIIKFYSNLKTCNESVESICENFGLSKYLDTYTVNLSGGNKRKLTFAIAMMNKPSLLLLDEPSTGVDPESRRIMWRNINKLSNSGHKYNMILTTHSMEEAEVLCDTVSWFKAGNFITLGNPEELKIRYSAGYKLHIKFDDEKINNNISNNINETFNNSCRLIEGINIYSNYILSNPGLEPYLRNLNEIIEQIKNKTEKISLDLIGKDLSFDLVITIIKQKQKDLFSQVLNMKNINNTIAEMSIAMQSLENILTSLN